MGSKSSSEDTKLKATSKIYNADTIASHRLLGIHRVVSLKIVIEGTIIPVYHEFSLYQSVFEHHQFELKIPYDSLDEEENHELHSAQEFLGKRLTAVFSYKDIEDSPERVFVGVVMEVGYEQEDHSLGKIVIRGNSPSILLDLAPHTQSFGGGQSISLASIAQQVIEEGINVNKYEVRIECGYTKNLSYSSQYNETHYNYLARMAASYGEQFFYDGEVLHFGKVPTSGTSLELIYGSNLFDVKVKMQAKHVSPTFYGYSSSRDEKLNTQETDIKHVSDIANRAYHLSKSHIRTSSLRVAPIRASTDKDIEISQKGAAGSNASEVFITTGSTSIPFLYPGCVADLRMRKRDTNDTDYFTKIQITKIEHQIDGRGQYNANFEAIAADSGHLPGVDYEEPLAEFQVAKVVSNSDPDGQGRVQVRFDWQHHESTDWLRVMTPDAGGSDKVSKNRGFMAIPEVGDQVMVGFQHNHPDRPFVMGGMFHGKVGGGGGKGNNIKSLSSKSGNIIQLNDAAGIEIKDRNGNHVTLSGTGNLTTNISADYTENVGGSQTTNVTTQTTIDVGKGQSIITMDDAGKVSITSATEIKFETGSSSITLNTDGTIIISGKLIAIGASKGVGINGTDAVTVVSKLVKINGSTQVDIN